jgi:L-fuculose-phosphate aldolase
MLRIQERIMVNEEELRRSLIRYCSLVYTKGWAANHDGNLSARLGNNLLCTPTAVSKGDVTHEMLIVLDSNNKVIQGSRRSFGELHLHLAAYQARADIGCVIHARPPTATGFCVAQKSLGEAFIAGSVASLGQTVPLIPFFPPKDKKWDEAIAKGLQNADVLMLSNQGVLSVGGSFEQAFLRMELVEHLCKIALVASQLGGPVPVPAEVIKKLLEKGRPKSNPSFGEHKTISSVDQELKRPDLNRMIKENRRRFE